jgi:hypothetical protein
VGYALNHTSFGALVGRPAGDAAKPGLLHRFYSAFMHARQCQADRVIAGYFAQSGRVLTDEAEREMMRRAISAGGWTAYR